MTSAQSKKRDFLARQYRYLEAHPDERQVTVEDLYAAVTGPGIPIEGFTITQEKSYYGNTRYRITHNTLHRSCILEFNIYNKKIHFSVILDMHDGVECQWYVHTPGCVYQFLENMEGIEKKYREYAAKAEKQEKIANLAKDGTRTWLNEILKDSPYMYYIREMAKGIVVCIQLKNRTQLNISIDYKSFQETMPELLSTIQAYENLVNTGKFKVIIENCSPYVKWGQGPLIK
jgi:hypothetical protein